MRQLQIRFQTAPRKINGNDDAENYVNGEIRNKQNRILTSRFGAARKKPYFNNRLGDL